MPNRTDASVAFSVTDNLSASIVGMKNSVNSFESDITGLQQKLDQLDATRIQLKNFDLKNARQELTRTRQALEELVLEASAHLEGPVLLDSGCGEGYYTAGMFRALERAGHRPRAAGIDISKYALRRAAKRLPEGEFAVASAYRLPLADASADLLTNVFSPLSAEEFARVLRPGGTFLYVVPSARHLWEMKQVLYSQPYENPVKETPYTGFSYQRIVPVRYEITLDCPEDIRALFQMTPYYWKTPREGAERLAALDGLRVRASFRVHVFRRR